MFYTIKIRKPGYLPAIAFTIGAIIMLIMFAINIHAIKVMGQSGSSCLVIDPGHGGIDGGAVSVGGKKESDINLAIGLKLQKIAEFYGVDTVMTRTDDSARTDVKNYSEHEDLVHRTEIINSVPGGVLFSIHQNCYLTSQPSGAQILYGAADGSMELGRITHENIINCLEPENRRVAEPAPKGLFITANASCPSVLAECGFMSSFSDIEKLITGEYQTSLATVFFASYAQFTASAAIS